jgi:DNA-binding transcriptional LysR family regulator
MDTLVSIRVFCLVAEMKSFAAAAGRLGISPAMASKHVMQLERRLSTRLLNRTSRRVSLSETGALYFEEARQMLESLDEIEAVVSKACQSGLCQPPCRLPLSPSGGAARFRSKRPYGEPRRRRL